MDWMPLKAGLFVWEHILSQHFPEQQSTRGSKIGRPPVDLKRTFLGICYILGSGAPWRALPPNYGKRSTVHRYFLQWAEEGLFLKLWQELLVRFDREKGLKLRVQIVDSTQSMVVHIELGKAVVSPKYQGKRALKISLLVDRQGIPIAMNIASAHVHDTRLLDGTLKASQVDSHQQPSQATLIGDKGYVGPRPQKIAENHGYEALIEPRYYHQDRLTKSRRRLLYRFRWVVERSISWLKNYRRLRFCYERSIRIFEAFSVLACCLLITGKLKQLL